MSFTLDHFSILIQTLDFLTGSPAPERLVTSPTVIFTRYSFALPAGATANVRLDKLEIKDDKVVLQVTAAGGKFKIQANDRAQGGVLQTEPELGTNIELTRVLGPNMFYFVNEFTGKVRCSLETLRQRLIPTLH